MLIKAVAYLFDKKYIVKFLQFKINVFHFNIL